MLSNSPPLTRERIQIGCRRLNADRHPLLRQLSCDDIDDGGNGMAPGGLILAEMLADEETADRVWKLWAHGHYSDDRSVKAWLEIAALAGPPCG